MSVTGDGVVDLAFGGGPGGAPRVRLFDGRRLLAAEPFVNVDEVAGAAQFGNFFAGDPALRRGVPPALRDADDGRADLIAGSREGEPSRVWLYKAATLLAEGSPSPDPELDPFVATVPGGVFVG